jgi:hypothetical protein
MDGTLETPIKHFRLADTRAGLKQDLLNSKYITVKVNTDYFQVKDKLKCG